MDLIFYDKKTKEERKITFDTQKVNVFDIKIRLYKEFKIRADSFHLEQSNETLRDDVVIDITACSMLQIKRSSTVVQVKVSIDTEGFENAIIDTFDCCSIKMVKYFLSLKTDLLISSMVIASSDKIESEGTFMNEIENNLMPTEPFSTSISEISAKSFSPIDKPVITLNLLIKRNNKFKFGLDFAFNSLNDISQTSFDLSAPSFREISDGMSMLFTCSYRKCSIYQQLFSIHIGFKKIEVKNFKNKIVCPKCGKNPIDFVKLVFIKCIWAYSASINETIVNGDGKTYGSNFFFTENIDLTKFEKLFLQVKSLNDDNFEVTDKSCDDTERMSDCLLF